MVIVVFLQHLSVRIYRSIGDRFQVCRVVLFDRYRSRSQLKQTLYRDGQCVQHEKDGQTGQRGRQIAQDFIVGYMH